MKRDGLVRKICLACGAKRLYRPGVTSCARFYATSGHTCNGPLKRVRRTKRPTETLTPQARAAKLFDRACAKAREHMSETARHAKLAQKWTTKSDYYAKRACMSDEQIAADREKRKRKPKRIRGINLKGGTP